MSSQWVVCYFGGGMRVGRTGLKLGFDGSDARRPEAVRRRLRPVGES
jgi:hypothetical protein